MQAELDCLAVLTSPLNLYLRCNDIKLASLGFKPLVTQLRVQINEEENITATHHSSMDSPYNGPVLR